VSETVAYIALGSNLGDRAGYLARARAAIAALRGTRLVGESDVEETSPIGPSGQGPYLNQMVAIETTLEPGELLTHLLAIERANGRQRTERWGSRTLDLDIVRYGDRSIAEPGLTIPHPELPNRDFWQRELAQLDSHP
jgi:2-amino-4-hydroxy-6-hydroxymethyldihydropteridine diphosphokinase